MDDLYNVERLYFEGGKSVLRRGLTLDEAQAHCQDPETSSSTCSAAKAASVGSKQWFDCYTEA